MARFFQRARREMERKGTVGAFTRSAKAAGRSVAEHSRAILASPSASTKQKRRAAFAKAARTVARRRKARG